MRRLLIILVAVLVIPLTAAGFSHHPETIDLPEGFQGEGIAVGRGHAFYAGSLADGRIAIGDLRKGTSEVWVSEPVIAPAVGLWADVRHGLLWVAGGPTGMGAAYDLGTGEAVASFVLTTDASFINDVVVARGAAYFTNSFTPEIYKVPVRHGDVGDPETIPLSGPAAAFVEGFNLNGIEATHNGKDLIVVNSALGTLYAVSPRTGASRLIDLGGESVPTGDGLLLVGPWLLVLQNGTVPGVPNQISVVRLSRWLGHGKVVKTITSPLFETATTLARDGSRLAAVNAQFAGAPIDPEPEVVILKPRRH
jgi:hypothetical protein